jgi:hypothetical protein
MGKEDSRLRKIAMVSVAAVLWAATGYTQDRLKKAIVLDESLYMLDMCTLKGANGVPMLDLSKPENRAYCATMPAKDKRRDNLMEVRTIFATMPACAGISMVVLNDPNKANSPEMMKAKLADSSWWLWLGHLTELRPGQVYWEVKGGESDSDFDGVGTPREAVAKVCAIVQGKGGAVSGN